MNKNKSIPIITFAVIIIFVLNLKAHTAYLNNKQPWSIRHLINKEKSIDTTREVITLINGLDDIYSNLYHKLNSGKKLTVFFDPAHGKNKRGLWRGGAITGRLSCTNQTEESYSIKFSRKMYKLLMNNKYLTVSSTKDYMPVLKGESEDYKSISFKSTVNQAKKSKAFIIISEHLNNVSMFNKASGKANIKGFHITHNHFGRNVLRYVKGSYDGFLTLYNKLDGSGFSRDYALLLKKNFIAQGLKANNWGYGAVGDSRFTYFVDFPISIIYESGFISNPIEEKKMSDPNHIDLMVNIQYTSMLDMIKNTFAIDISNDKIKKVHSKRKIADIRLELLKLSRLAVYYIKSGKTKSAIRTINIMNRRFKKTKYKVNIAYFNDIKRRILKGERYYHLALKKAKKIAQLKKRRTWRNRKKVIKARKKARHFIWKAKRSIPRRPIYIAYNKKFRLKTINKKLNKKKKNLSSNVKIKTKKKIRKRRKSRFEKYMDFCSVERFYSYKSKRAPRNRPIIFTISKKQSIRDAVEKSLSPSGNTKKLLVKSFKNCRIKQLVKVRKRKVYFKKISYWKKKKIRIKKSKYSSKHKKYITYYRYKNRWVKLYKTKKIVKYRTKWVNRTKKIKFKKGIYLVVLNRDLSFKSVKKVSAVTLNPDRFQNQLYLKNSYFTYQTKIKSL